MFAFVGSLRIDMVRAAVRAAVRFSWPNGCNEQRPTQTRLWSAKKATLMTQVRFEVRFELRFEVRFELRFEVRFEVRGIKLTLLEI